MKKTLLVLSVVLVSSLAWASAALLGSTVSNGNSVIPVPSGASAGFPLVNPGSITAFNVTIADVRDGSVGDTLDSVLAATAFAWCLPGTFNLQEDGGAGWARMPELDLQMRITDAGTGVGGTGEHAALNGTARASTVGGNTGVNCSRIAYTAGSVNASWDGGSLVYRLSVFQAD
jgi:hypothetical protein